MFIIAFKGFGSLLEARHCGKMLASLCFWFVWQEKNVRIFEDKEKTEKEVWDFFFFFRPCGLHVSLYLEEFNFQSYDLINWWCVIDYPNRGSMGLGHTSCKFRF